MDFEGRKFSAAAIKFIRIVRTTKGKERLFDFSHVLQVSKK